MGLTDGVLEIYVRKLSAPMKDNLKASVLSAKEKR